MAQIQDPTINCTLKSNAPQETMTRPQYPVGGSDVNRWLAETHRSSFIPGLDLVAPRTSVTDGLCCPPHVVPL